MNMETVINLLAGGIGGTVGAVVTCPLEVVKTRLQSSSAFKASSPTSGQHTNCGVVYSGASSSSCSYSSSGGANNYSNSAAMSKKFFDTHRCSLINRQLKSHVVVTSVTNLQTNSTGFRSLVKSALKIKSAKTYLRSAFFSSCHKQTPHRRNDFLGFYVYKHLRDIVKREGLSALWRGLGPTLIGVAPSRAIYFCAYSNAKSNMNGFFVPETPVVHVFSAAFAGFCSATCTNPLWLIRTRLQLDRMTGDQKLTVFKCMQKVYKENRILGFYKGVTASYIGIAETIIHFVIYEYLKSRLSSADSSGASERHASHFFKYMMCASVSRLVATTVAYPHEVLRTRLREEGSKYRSVRQSVRLILREESWRGFYNGLSVHLLRSIPNTAVTMATYELIVYLLLRPSAS